MKIRRKKGVAALFAAIVALAAVGAYAYWTTSGSGTGGATAGTTAALTIVQDNTVTGLYPGGSPVGLNGHFVSTNVGSVTVNSVTAAVTGVTGAGTDPGQPACTTADFVIGGASGPYVVANGSGTLWSGLTVQLADGVANQDNCKGASAVITYTANATP